MKSKPLLRGRQGTKVVLTGIAIRSTIPISIRQIPFDVLGGAFQRAADLRSRVFDQR